MTDKQIENELHLFQNRFINNDKIWLFIQNTLDYIDRLKAENERLTNTAYNVGVKVAEYTAEETRKETIKTILLELASEYDDWGEKRFSDYEAFRAFAKKHGVEVDE